MEGGGEGAHWEVRWVRTRSRTDHDRRGRPGSNMSTRLRRVEGRTAALPPAAQRSARIWIAAAAAVLMPEGAFRHDVDCNIVVGPK